MRKVRVKDGNAAARAVLGANRVIAVMRTPLPPDAPAIRPA
jgi:hypothetical protein